MGLNPSEEVVSTDRRRRPGELDKVWSNELGSYGEPLGYSTIELKTGDDRITTRVHVWTVERGGLRNGFQSRGRGQPPLEPCQ